MSESQSDAPVTPASPLTRRGLIRNAATAGAVAATAGLLASAADGTAQAATGAAADRARAAESAARAELAEPLLVRVADARTGALDLFHGDTHRTVRDPQLAQALIDAAR